ARDATDCALVCALVCAIDGSGATATFAATNNVNANDFSARRRIFDPRLAAVLPQDLIAAALGSKFDLGRAIVISPPLLPRRAVACRLPQLGRSTAGRCHSVRFEVSIFVVV